MRAVLIGATGLVGGHCLTRLLADKRTASVSVYARGKAPTAHPKLLWREADLSAVPEFSADEFYCCLGTTLKKAGGREAFRKIDLELPLLWARAARAGGVPRAVLVSSVGADIDSSNFYLSVKGEVERAFADLRFPYLGILRPSLLLGQRSESRVLERIGQTVFRGLSPLFVGGLRRYRAIGAEAVGAAMVRAARSPDQGIRIYEYDAMMRLI